jgi:hypothetical protein
MKGSKKIVMRRKGIKIKNKLDENYKSLIKW